MNNPPKKRTVELKYFSKRSVNIRQLIRHWEVELSKFQQKKMRPIMQVKISSECQIKLARSDTYGKRLVEKRRGRIYAQNIAWREGTKVSETGADTTNEFF